LDDVDIAFSVVTDDDNCLPGLVVGEQVPNSLSAANGNGDNPEEGKIHVDVQIKETRKFVFYPNPTSSIINFEFTELEHAGELKIMDMAGRLVHEQDLQQEQQSFKLDVSDSRYVNGMYIIQVKINDEIITERVMINK